MSGASSLRAWLLPATSCCLPPACRSAGRTWRLAFLWRALLASVYGGVNEEIYARLFVFSVAAWLLAKTSTSAAAPTVLQLWLANAIAALIFAIGHLPLTKVAMGLNFVTVARALALNGIPYLFLAGYIGVMVSGRQ